MAVGTVIGLADIVARGLEIPLELVTIALKGRREDERRWREGTHPLQDFDKKF